MRLRHLLQVAPSPSEVRHLPDDLEVTFAPMEALSDGLGGLDVSRSKPLSEVAKGSYNYFAEGDVLLAKVTPCFENGKKAVAEGLANGIGFATSEVHVLRPDPERINTSYLRYLLSSERFRAAGMRSMTGAGGLRRVSEAAIKDFILPTADLDTQKAIAGFLDKETARIDQLIEKKQRLVELLGEREVAHSEAIVRGQYQPDFDPTSEIALGVRGCPTSWPRTRVRFVINGIEQGWSPQCYAGEVEGSQWGVVTLAAITSGVFAEVRHKVLPPELEPRPHLKIEVGDVLVARASGSPALVGRACYVGRVSKQLMLSDKHYRLRYNRRIIDPVFLTTLINSRQSRVQIESRLSSAEGMARNIGMSVIQQLSFGLPSMAEQRQIRRDLELATEASRKVRESVQASIDRLKEYRSALITAAVTGQIDVTRWGRTGEGDKRLDQIQEEMAG